MNTSNTSIHVTNRVEGQLYNYKIYSVNVHDEESDTYINLLEEFPFVAVTKPKLTKRSKFIQVDFQPNINVDSYNIYVDDVLVDNVASTETTYTFNNLNRNTNYNLKIVSVKNNIERRAVEMVTSTIKAYATEIIYK